MAIDIKSQEAIKKLKLVDLVNDAVERGDKAALEWLKKEANTLKKRTKAGKKEPKLTALLTK